MRLPIGDTSSIRGIGETFSFHSSPESFFALRLERVSDERLSSGSTKGIILRAKILNRNVACVSSYHHICQILGHGADVESNEPNQYVAAKAYQDFMSPFFPVPNVMLTDGNLHATQRAEWNLRTDSCIHGYHHIIREITLSHFQSLSQATSTDLYASMKDLAWKILLRLFLGLDMSMPLFARIQSLQEDILRGQFSLLPININVGFWSSPRNRGLQATEKLRTLLLDMFSSNNSGSDCLGRMFVNSESKVNMQYITDHLILFTSSLAAKSLASLFTALFLNIFVYAKDGETCASMISRQPDLNSRRRLIESILLETERLSPPIVGNMRRCMRDCVIKSDQEDYLIPAGWDVWCYFVGAGRDPGVFGDRSQIFNPERYLTKETAQPLAFGFGSKACLGREMMREVIMTTGLTCMELGINMKARVDAPGVQEWLGWKENNQSNAEDWLRDMKQIPTQRPAEPIIVQFSCN